MAVALLHLDGGALLSPCCGASVMGSLNDHEDDQPFWDDLWCESCAGDVHPDEVVRGPHVDQEGGS